MVKDHFPGSWTIARHHVDDAIRKARCFEYLHDYLRAVDLGVGRLPDNDVAHQSGGSAQVGSDCRKVEGGYRKNETFQTAVFHPVPNAVLTIRLNILNFLEEIGVKAQEINQFTGRINFRLEDVLGLRQHGGRIDFSAVGSCNQIRRLEKHRRTFIPWKSRPRWSSGECRINCSIYMACIAVIKVPEDMLVIVRRGHRPFVIGSNCILANVHRYINGRLAVHLTVHTENFLAFSSAWSVG